MLQTGTSQVFAFRKETTLGVLPANDAQAFQLRRDDIGLKLTKDSIKSKERRPDRQRSASRHAMRKVDGTIKAALYLGAFSSLMGSAVRRAFGTVAALTPLTNVTASATAPHFVRAAGDWIAAGLRVGMTFRWVGWASPAAGNNNKNYTIVALTATGITVAETVTAKASGD